jgi:hypothetical protein
MMRISIEFGATNPQRYLKAIECREIAMPKRQRIFHQKQVESSQRAEKSSRVSLHECEGTKGKPKAIQSEVIDIL